MRPNIVSAAAAAFLLSLLSLDSAVAVGGCSPGFHRNSYGRCHPNAAPTVVAPLCRDGFRWDSTLRRCVVIYIGGA